jgi:hypothetical protein
LEGAGTSDVAEAAAVVAAVDAAAADRAKLFTLATDIDFVFVDADCCCCCCPSGVNTDDDDDEDNIDDEANGNGGDGENAIVEDAIAIIMTPMNKTTVDFFIKLFPRPRIPMLLFVDWLIIVVV